MTLTPPPPMTINDFHYTPCQARVLSALKDSREALSIIEISRRTGLSRCTIYDCVTHLSEVIRVAGQGRMAYYGVRR